MALRTDRPSTSRSAGVVEVSLFALSATALCALVASPALLGWMPEDVAGLMVPVAQLTPLVAALVWWWLRRAPGSLREVLALRWSWRGIGIGLCAVAVISGLQLLMGLATGWHLAPHEVVLTASAAVIPVLVLQSVFAIGEELGWRGWLATRTASWPFVAAALVSSVVWAVWHLPAVALIAGEGQGEIRAAYLLGIAAWAPFLLALRRATGSVWSAVVTHGALNSIRVFVLQSIPATSGVSWSVEATGWVLWLLAAWWLAARSGRP